MKIVINSEKAPTLLFTGPAVTSIPVRTMAELEGHRELDLYIDLDFKVEEDRLSALSLLLPSPVIVNAVVPTLAEIGRPFIRLNGWPGCL